MKRVTFTLSPPSNLVQNIILRSPWLLLSLILFATNSHISPEQYLTKISALDTSIYLAIAEAAPSLPANGSDLVYHGAQRFFLPYLLGVVSKATGISAWSLFQLATHLMVLFTLRTFWMLSGRFQVSHGIRLVATAIFCFHVYLFRLHLTFSGFLNDGLFVLGFTYAIRSLLEKSQARLMLGILFMVIAKQTTVFVLPVLTAWTFIDADWKSTPRHRLAIFWAASWVILFAHFYVVAKIIQPFSSSATTFQMASGFMQWLRETPFLDAVSQYSIFLARGLLGILTPLLFFFIVWRSHATDLKTTRSALWLALLGAAICQPFISGPAITGPSIQRLISLGIVPLLGLTLQLPGIQCYKLSPKKAWAVVGIIVLASFHHLFSRLGPNLNYRYLFLAIHLSCAVLAIRMVWQSRSKLLTSNGTHLNIS